MNIAYCSKSLPCLKNSSDKGFRQTAVLVVLNCFYFRGKRNKILKGFLKEAYTVINVVAVVVVVGGGS
jgi:hypothetical protein